MPKFWYVVSIGMMSELVAKATVAACARMGNALTRISSRTEAIRHDTCVITSNARSHGRDGGFRMILVLNAHPELMCCESPASARNHTAGRCRALPGVAEYCFELSVERALR